MSRPPLFRTDFTFADPGEAVEFYNSHRVEPDKMKAIGRKVLKFLEAVAEYDDRAVFNVQPALRQHYIAAASPDDHHPWFFAKPHGVVFTLGDPRNVAAVLSMWGEPHQVPQKLMPTDVWFDLSELGTAGAVFCLRLSAEWAAWRTAAGQPDLK